MHQYRHMAKRHLVRTLIALEATYGSAVPAAARKAVDEEMGSKISLLKHDLKIARRKELDALHNLDGDTHQEGTSVARADKNRRDTTRVSKAINRLYGRVSRRRR